jgi:hypothetical protein
MTIIRNECCDCAVPAYPCIGKRCPLHNQKVYICDECKDEVDELYEFESEELCIDCIKKRLKVVE